jgi:opacity protein-like surface antigen
MNSSKVCRLIQHAVFGIGLFVLPTLFAGPEPIADVKDYSKEPPPIEKSWCETPPSWEVRIALPGWISNLSGDFGVKGIVAPLDIGFDTLLKHLEHVPIVLSAYARYGRWEIFGDGEWIQLHDSVTLPGLLFTNADLGLGYAFWEGFLGYRVINCDNASLSLYAGARYNYYSGDLDIENNNDPRFPIIRQLLGIPNNLKVSASTDWVDPVVGVGGHIRLYKALSFWANGDVGGFDANSGSAFKLRRQGRRPVLESASSSDWSYQAQGGIEIQLTHSIYSQIGWRYLKYDYKINGFVNETDLNGPFIQTGINF